MIDDSDGIAMDGAAVDRAQFVFKSIEASRLFR
jgi:hypothetical protein